LLFYGINSGIFVVNLYAFRSTSPAGLLSTNDPVGPANDDYLIKASKLGDICLAWGTNAEPTRASMVVELIRETGKVPFCLGKTKWGFPRHPLFVKSEQKLIGF